MLRSLSVQLLGQRGLTHTGTYSQALANTDDHIHALQVKLLYWVIRKIKSLVCVVLSGVVQQQKSQVEEASRSQSTDGV